MVALDEVADVFLCTLADDLIAVRLLFEDGLGCLNCLRCSVDFVVAAVFADRLLDAVRADGVGEGGGGGAFHKRSDRFSFRWSRAKTGFTGCGVRFGDCFADSRL